MAFEWIDRIDDVDGVEAKDVNTLAAELIRLGKKLEGLKLVGKQTEENGEVFNDYADNKAYGPYVHVEGKSNQAGIKGFYYSRIDFGMDSDTITLSNVQGYGTDTSVDLSEEVAKYEVGALISIINDSKYPNCCKILSISGNKITVEKLPFAEIADQTIVEVDDYAVWVQEQPTVGAVSLGQSAHTEGEENVALERSSHAEGRQNTSYGAYSHTEGRNNRANYCGHAEGRETSADGGASHAEGRSTQANGVSSHAEGQGSVAEGPNSHAEGQSSIALGDKSHAEGHGTHAEGEGSHSEGVGSNAAGKAAHAEGNKSSATGEGAHAEGYNTQAKGGNSHAEGSSTQAIGGSSHAEGQETEASGSFSHTEGRFTKAIGTHSHAEGKSSQATAAEAHAEGTGTKANAVSSHTEGAYTVADGDYAHAEGVSTQANGVASHAEGRYTTAKGEHQHVQGKFNAIDNDNKFAHIVGNGTANNFAGRKNIHTLDWDGNATFAGDVYVQNTDKQCGKSTGKKLATEEFVSKQLLNHLTYAGVVVSPDGYSMSPWQGSKPDEIYVMISESLLLSHGGNVNIPFQEVIDGKLFTLDRTAYDDLIFAGMAGSYIYLAIGLKTDSNHDTNQPIILESAKLTYVGDTYIEFIGAASPNSSIQDLASVDWSLYEIKYMDYTMEISKGQGLIWTGNAWMTI